MTKKGVGPLRLEKILFQNNLSKIQNLKHKYGTTKAQFLKKTNGAQISIDKKPIPPKKICNRTQCLDEGL
jgi:hypothetical protein